MIYQIETQTGFGKTATGLEVVVVNYNFGVYLTVAYGIIDTNGSYILQGNMNFGSDIINNWGSDDNYIINLVCSNLGLIKI